MFREIHIPKSEIEKTNHKESVGVGRFLLTSLPGKYEAFHVFLKNAVKEEVDLVICLIADLEIKLKSPRYYRAINSKDLPFQLISHPIDNFFIPLDISNFSSLCQSVAEKFLQGETILIHCSEGIGRTGLFSCCVLHELFINKDLAANLVNHAGSSPEGFHQHKFVIQHAENLHHKKMQL